MTTELTLTLPEYQERYPRLYAQLLRIWGPLMKQFQLVVTAVRLTIKNGRPVHVHYDMTDLLD